MNNSNFVFAAKLAFAFTRDRRERPQTLRVAMMTAVLTVSVIASLWTGMSLSIAVEQFGSEPRFTRAIVSRSDTKMPALPIAEFDRFAGNRFCRAIVPWQSIEARFIAPSGAACLVKVRSTRLNADPDLRLSGAAPAPGTLIITAPLATRLGLSAGHPTAIQMTVERPTAAGAPEHRSAPIPVLVIPEGHSSDPLYQAFWDGVAEMAAWTGYDEEQAEPTADRLIVHAGSADAVQPMVQELARRFGNRGYSVHMDQAQLDQFKRASRAAKWALTGVCALLCAIWMLAMLGAGDSVVTRAAGTLRNLRLAGASPSFLRRWLMLCVGGAAVVGVLIGTALGAVAAPPLVRHMLATCGEQFEKLPTTHAWSLAVIAPLGILLAMLAAVISSRHGVIRREA